jgi:uncharacterized protein YlxP (DUF503 family)
MVIAVGVIELHLPGAHSLKDKRSVVKSITARLHREFNISCGEVGLHDTWQSAMVGIAVVSTAVPHAQSVLESVVHWIEINRPDVQVIDHTIEIIP